MPDIKKRVNGSQLRPHWQTTDGETVRLFLGDVAEVLGRLPRAFADAVVTDPPYGLEFLGKEWDSYARGKPAQEFYERWALSILRALKPGGFMVCFGGTRTYHRLACAVEDAGFEVRDCLMWMYGSGFPKRRGCLKPAWEPILLCRKPGAKVLPLGINECRVPTRQGDYYHPDNDGIERFGALPAVRKITSRPRPRGRRPWYGKFANGN